MKKILEGRNGPFVAMGCGQKEALSSTANIRHRREDGCIFTSVWERQN